MSFLACPICARAMTPMLGGTVAFWRCELCANTAELSARETLIASGTAGAAAGSGTDLFLQYRKIAGLDPTSLKVEGKCPDCKKTTIMSLAFLGDNEQPLFSCPCGASFASHPG